MRKYPKKCKKCGNFMEPKFDDGIGRSKSGTELISNINQSPNRWVCDCGNVENVKQ